MARAAPTGSLCYEQWPEQHQLPVYVTNNGQSSTNWQFMLRTMETLNI